jgi:hypothetical protein
MQRAIEMVPRHCPGIRSLLLCGLPIRQLGDGFEVRQTSNLLTSVIIAGDPHIITSQGHPGVSGRQL